jgi:hypothetical protein
MTQIRPAGRLRGIGFLDEGITILLNWENGRLERGSPIGIIGTALSAKARSCNLSAG